MTTTPGYTDAAWREAIREALRRQHMEGTGISVEGIERRAAELTQVTAQSVEQMRPQSAVQGVPDWAWRQAFGLFVTNNEIMDEFNDEDFDEIKTHASELAAAPQPPQGEGQ